MTIQSRILAAVAIVILAPGSAFAAPWVRPTRGPTTFLAKVDGTAEQRNADQARCREIVSNADSADMPQVDAPSMQINTSALSALPQYNTVGGAIGLGVAMLIVGAVEDAKAARRGENLCMYNMGYRAVPMTPAELATYAKLPSHKQKEWERNLMPADTADRLAPVLKPLVPRLLPYEPDAPLVDGGIRIADLSLAAQEIHEKGLVVKGTAMRRRTATLVTPIESKDGPIRIAADPGTVFQEIDTRTQKEPMLRQDSSTWCGTMRQMAAGNVAKDYYCLTGRDNGYEVIRPSGRNWMPDTDSPRLILPIYTQPITLEERKQDDLGPMELELKVAKIENSGVYIAGDVRRGHEAVRMWLRRIPFDKNVAVLPLWDSKLTLTRLPNKDLKAELTHDGDGSGWRVGEAARSPFEY